MDAALPPPFTARAPTAEDAAAVVELVVACELADTGVVLMNRQELEGDWVRPHFDLALDALLVLEDGRAVAEAEVGQGRADVSVHPDRRGRGIGGALLQWVEARAREKRADTLRQVVPESARDAAALLEAAGYAPTYTSWTLALDLREPPAEPEPPAGVTLRTYRAPDEEHAVHRVVDDAFSEWDHRDPTPFEDWAGYMIRRPDFDPSLLYVADAGGDVVGAAICFDYPETRELWIGQLAVDRDRRGRGIGRALLQRAFVEARRRGRRACLSTDSRSGALTLYERVGMRVETSWTNYQKAL